MNKTLDLLDLYERKKDAILEMDGFQIAGKIEHLVSEILQEIFKLEPLKRSYTEDGSFISPDIEFRIPALGRVKNIVFFEVKMGDLAEFEVLQIEELIRHYRGGNQRNLYSVVVIARSFKNAERVEKLYQRLCQAFSINIGFMSVQTLAAIAELLQKDPAFNNTRIRNSFITDLLSVTGIVNVKSVLTKFIDTLNFKLDHSQNSLESMKVTLSYLETQHSKLLEKRKLKSRLKDLYRAMLWARVKERRINAAEYKQLTEKFDAIKKTTQTVLSILENIREPHDKAYSSILTLKNQINEIDEKIRSLGEYFGEDLSSITREALEKGSEIETTASFADLAADSEEIIASLNELGDVNEEAESMYISTKKALEEMEKKAASVNHDKIQLLNLRDKLREELSVLENPF